MKTKSTLLAFVLTACAASLWLWHSSHRATRHAAASGSAGEHRVSPLTSSGPSGAKGAPAAQAPSLDGSAAASVPGSVAPILDLSHDLLDRQQRVRRLGKHLSGPQVQALCSFLRQHNGEDDGQVGQVLKNDLLDLLCSQNDLPQGLAGLLADLFRDPAQNAVVRDYAVQHLEALYGELDRASSWPQAEVQSQKVDLQALLWQATQQTNSSIAGTALLALARLANTYPEFDRKRVGQTALSLAQDTAAGELTRITSFQVCARCQIAEALPLLANAAEKLPDACLRISAIGALGSLATQDQLPLLERLAAGGDPRISPAARLALNRTKQRLGQL